VNVVGKLALNIALFLFFATAGLAKDGLVVSPEVDPQVRDQAQRIYASACTTVEREFGAARPLRPRIFLFLGSDQDSVDWGRSEIRLRDWDPNLFAQSVIILAYRQVMPLHVGLTATEALRMRHSNGRRNSQVNHCDLDRDVLFELIPGGNLTQIERRDAQEVYERWG
jgi:hypothetical protein